MINVLIGRAAELLGEHRPSIFLAACGEASLLAITEHMLTPWL
jgi:hypothetical protein